MPPLPNTATAGTRRLRWTLGGLLAAALAASALLAGCPRRIGDGCTTNTDCSLQGDRQCDITQRGGYCTVPECSPNSCPDNASCVEFQAGLSRTTRRFCVHPCNNDGDCRGDYQCVRVTIPPGSADAGCPAAEADSGAMTPECTRIVDTDGGTPGYCVQRLQ